MAAKRTSWRKVSDRATDDRRRITISARVPKDQGDYFKLLAKLSRRSLYRFVLDALEAEAAMPDLPALEAEAAANTERLRIRIDDEPEL